MSRLNSLSAMISADKALIRRWLQTRPARRSLLRCEQTRKEAIFLRTVTFEGHPRKFFGAEDDVLFIDWLSD